MTKGLWLNETTFVPLSQISKDLNAEIATRQFALGEWAGFFTQLPDPDPILRKLGGGTDQQVYEDLLSDHRVGAMVGRRKNLTKAKDWSINANGAGDKEVELCQLLLQTWKDAGIKIKDIISQSLNPILYGYSPFELDWQPVGKYWLPVSVQEKPREWFFYDGENRPRFRSMTNWEGLLIAGKDVEPRIAARFIILVNDPTYKNPYGDKAISRCFWPVTFKRGGMTFFSEFLERFGMPFIFGKLPRSATPDQHDQLFNQLINFIRGAVGTGPDDSSVQLIETKGGSGSTDLYKNYIEMCDNAISEAILTNSLSTSIQQSGARAASETGADTIESGLGNEDMDFPTALFNTIFKRVIDFNLGTGKYPEFEFAKIEEVKEGKAKRDVNLQSVGVKFKKNYFVNNYGLKEDEFEIKEPEQPEKNNLPVAAPQIGNEPINNPQRQKTELSVFQKLWNKFFRIDLSAEKNILEQIADTLPDKALQFAIEETIRPVIELSQKAASREEFLNSLAKLYPDMKTDQFENLLTKALFIAELQGYTDADKETK